MILGWRQLSLILLWGAPLALAQDDFFSLPDASPGLQALVEENMGQLSLAGGIYRLTRTVEFDLAKLGAATLRADGPVTVVMDGPGPAFRFTGTHEGTAAPGTFRPETWRERMPLVEGFEILGAHEEADGIELRGTMQATLTRLVIRKARHAIRLVERNRNVIIADCHLYENRGVGVYLDDVNLHQINVGNCHISYNLGGGVVVRDGNVRNLQIGNCDIEGNMPEDGTGSLAANVWIDSSAGLPGRSIAEVAITGSTIQHTGKSPLGANIRITGYEGWPVDMVTISGNLMSDAAVSLHFDYVNSATVTGNTFFTSIPEDVRVTRSSRLVFTGNVFDPRQARWKGVGGARFEDCEDAVLSGNLFVDVRNPGGALVLERCRRFTVQGCRLTRCAKGMVLSEVVDSLLHGCAVSDTAEGGLDVEILGGEGIDLYGNRFSGGVKGTE